MSIDYTLTNLQKELTLPSPLQLLHSPLLAAKDIKVYIKRDDLIDPYISGNKFRKLEGHLHHYSQQNYRGILTFGGAFSNHIYATAAVCKRLKIPLTCIIRAEEADLSNTTLSYVVESGAKVYRVSRSEYRAKHEGETAKSLLNPSIYCIPEGGMGQLSRLGVQRMTKEILDLLSPTHMAVSSGTGATSLGILDAMRAVNCKLLVAAAVRDESVVAMLDAHTSSEKIVHLPEQWGGYAKTKKPLIQFINNWESTFGIGLEPIYTGKLLYHLWHLIENGYFEPGSTLVAIHTGGLRPVSQTSTTLG